MLYTGVTNNLMRRVSEHKEKIIEGFTRKYNVTKLVYYEIYNEPYPAIQREKSIKGISRERKITLIKSMNPSWNDLMAMFE